MAPISSLFATSAVAHSGATIDGSRDLPVTVRTSHEPWRYALSFRRVADLPGAYAIGVRVRIAVKEGMVGVGWLDTGKKRFIDEIPVTAGPDVAIELLATQPFDLGPLMIRNWSNAGASTATVLGIECYTIDVDRDAEADSDTAREPPLSEPVATPNWNRYYGSRGRGLRERARVTRFESLTEPLTLTWSDGLSVRIVPGDQLSRAVYVSSTYEPNTLSLLRSLVQPGAVCLDVGANVGVVSLAVSRWVGPSGHVYAFEPSGREFTRLADHVALNGLAQVTAVRAAATAMPGQRVLRVAAAPRGGLNTLGNRFAYPEMPMAGMPRSFSRRTACAALSSSATSAGLPMKCVSRMMVPSRSRKTASTLTPSLASAHRRATGATASATSADPG